MTPQTMSRILQDDIIARPALLGCYSIHEQKKMHFLRRCVLAEELLLLYNVPVQDITKSIVQHSCNPSKEQSRRDAITSITQDKGHWSLPLSPVSSKVLSNSLTIKHKKMSYRVSRIPFENSSPIWPLEKPYSAQLQGLSEINLKQLTVNSRDRHDNETNLVQQIKSPGCSRNSFDTYTLHTVPESRVHVSDKTDQSLFPFMIIDDERGIFQQAQEQCLGQHDSDHHTAAQQSQTTSVELSSSKSCRIVTPTHSNTSQGQSTVWGYNETNKKSSMPQSPPITSIANLSSLEHQPDSRESNTTSCSISHDITTRREKRTSSSTLEWFDEIPHKSVCNDTITRHAKSI